MRNENMETLKRELEIRDFIRTAVMKKGSRLSRIWIWNSILKRNGYH